ncbi:MAG: sulfatase-like hydrolase/transferase [Myxococcota bacterium]
MRRVLQTAGRGAWVGGAAGLMMALGDFGAAWLWIPWWPDRLSLLWRLPALLAPLGATLGAVFGALAAVWEPLLRGRVARDDERRSETWCRRLWPLPFVLLASPPLVIVARGLFEGGKASQLPARGLLVTGAALALIAGTYAALRLARRSHERLRDAPARAAWTAVAALIGLHLGITKIDQHVYPKLYDDLHGLLSAGAFAVGALAVAVAAARVPAIRRRSRRVGIAGLAGLGALWALLALNLGTLEQRQNVRVAMFDPRAATARSVMQGLEPLLRSDQADEAAEAIARARRARARRQGVDSASLPVWNDVHVLLVTIDALRADHLGAYGYRRPVSPHIDALADDAVVFEQAYAAAPHSSYSLCSLMTSEYLHEAVDLGRPLPTATLPKALGEVGFRTAAFYTNGIFHTEGERVRRYRDDAFGFDLHDHHDVGAERKTDDALAEVDRIVARGEPPSFLWVHYFDVHEPYRKTTFGTSPMDRYDSEIRAVDQALARLLREARGRLSRDLIVVLTSDHGEEFRDHGGVYHGSSLYEEQVRVPLIVHAPGLEPRRVRAPVDLVDLGPTLLGMLGLPVPASMRGDDLRPLAVGTAETMGPAFAGVMRKRMVVKWPYKLIADLRFGLFELYDLSRDPGERQNLADREPEVVEDLRGELYAWLDDLQHPPGHGGGGDPRERALARGRLGDPRAVEPLGRLVEDEAAPAEMRSEGARLLGDLGDRSVADALARALRAPQPQVAAEAAIALGRLYDGRATSMLRHLVHAEDVDTRTRAAIALARLGDRAAIPALMDAVRAGPATQDRKEAVRWLGRLGATEAVQPLLDLLPELRLRSVAILALGEIGDPRAYRPLLEVLEWEHRPNIRDHAVRALGELGLARAVPHLVRLARTEPELSHVGEALVRLGSARRGDVGGADLGPAPSDAFDSCHAPGDEADAEEEARSWCVTARHRAAMPLPLPERVREAGRAIGLLRLRRHDAEEPTPVVVRVGDRSVAEMEVGGDWREHRVPLEPEHLAGGDARAVLEAADPSSRLALDYFLVIPGAAGPGAGS